MIFYGNWRSLAAYRVRVALALKNVPHEVVAVDMLGGEHLGARCKAINPQGVIPALDDGHGNVLFQSLAIVEYLDETYPEPPLLPRDPAGACARSRSSTQPTSIRCWCRACACTFRRTPASTTLPCSVGSRGR